MYVKTILILTHCEGKFQSNWGILVVIDWLPLSVNYCQETNKIERKYLYTYTLFKYEVTLYCADLNNKYLQSLQ